MNDEEIFVELKQMVHPKIFNVIIQIWAASLLITQKVLVKEVTCTATGHSLLSDFSFEMPF